MLKNVIYTQIYAFIQNTEHVCILTSAILIMLDLMDEIRFLQQENVGRLSLVTNWLHCFFRYDFIPGLKV